MAYAIIRIAKHSSNGSLGGMTKHNKRTIDVPNCDPEKTSRNKELIGTGDYVKDVNEFIQSRDLHVQKNSVKAIEHVITASPEWWQSKDCKPQEFYDKSLEFLQEFYGEKSKVVSISYHLDESTPHLHAFVVPVSKSKLKGGREIERLGAKKFIGTRQKLSFLQDQFADKVAHLGLERGVRKSKAKHQTIKKLYSNLNSAEQVPTIKPPKLEELPPRLGNRQEWLNKQNRDIQQQLQQSIEQANEVITDSSFLSASQQLQASRLKRVEMLANEERNKLVNRANQIIDKERTAKQQAVAEVGKLKQIEGNLQVKSTELKSRLEQTAISLRAREVQLEKAIKGELSSEEARELLMIFSRNQQRGR